MQRLKKAKSITIAEKLHKQDEATRKHFNSIEGIRHRRNEEQQRFSNNVRYYSDRKQQRPLYHDYNHGNFGSRFNGLNVG